MKLKYLGVLLFSISTVLALSRPGYSQEEIQYKKFKFDNASCDVGLLYKQTLAGKMDIGVSAMATGRGAEFRKWKVTYIKLNIDDERIAPDKDEKFYVTEESFWRYPAAILFVVLGATQSGPGTGVSKGITNAGLAIGMGLLVLQAKGEIEGHKCVFNLDKDLAEKIEDGKDFIEIRMEDERLHLQESVRIGIYGTAGRVTARKDYSKMDRKDLDDLVNTLKYKITSLEKEQADHKYGTDPEYDRIQRDIERLETERGLAYKAWFEKR